MSDIDVRRIGPPPPPPVVSVVCRDEFEEGALLGDDDDRMVCSDAERSCCGESKGSMGGLNNGSDLCLPLEEEIELTFRDKICRAEVLGESIDIGKLSTVDRRRCCDWSLSPLTLRDDDDLRRTYCGPC